jgi:hypothetical protein
VVTNTDDQELVAKMLANPSLIKDTSEGLLAIATEQIADLQRRLTEAEQERLEDNEALQEVIDQRDAAQTALTEMTAAFDNEVAYHALTRAALEQLSR